MKILKGSLFLFAVLIASVAAISSIKATPAKKTLASGPIWVKYSCTEGTAQTPVLEQPNLSLAQVTFADGQQSNFCEDLDDVICAAKYTYSDVVPNSTSQIILVGGQFKFNPDYAGGIDAAVANRLDIVTCPDAQ